MERRNLQRFVVVGIILVGLVLVRVLLVGLIVVRLVVVGWVVVRLLVVGGLLVRVLVVWWLLVGLVLVGFQLVRVRLEIGPRPSPATSVRAPPIALLPLGNRAGTASSARSHVAEHRDMTNEVDDPASAGDLRHPASARRGHRVHLLTVLLVATAVVLLIEVVAPLRELPAPREISWWALIPLFCAAEVFVVHLQFRRDAHSFSLSELPLVAGFFHRRQSPLKLAFNLANFTVANSVVAVLFMHLVDHHDPLSATSFLGVLVAILAGGVLQSLVILAAISFSEGRIDAAGIAATFGFTQAATVVNTCLALIGVRIVWENPAEIWLLAIPTIGVFIAYRFYVAEREKRDQVDFLYQSSKDLQRTATVDDAVAALLSKSCEVFRGNARRSPSSPPANAMPWCAPLSTRS